MIVFDGTRLQNFLKSTIFHFFGKVTEEIDVQGIFSDETQFMDSMGAYTYLYKFL